MSVVSHFVTRAVRVFPQRVVRHLCGVPASAASIRVPAGGDLQAAINAAQGGDDVLLAPAPSTRATSVCRPPTWRPTSRFAPSPGAAASGVRVMPARCGAAREDQSPNGSAALATADGAHHWRIENVEFPATAGGAGEIIALGSGSQTTAAQIPHDLVFDRVYIHGDPASASGGRRPEQRLHRNHQQLHRRHQGNLRGLAGDLRMEWPWSVRDREQLPGGVG
jgi:hypothetical protein